MRSLTFLLPAVLLGNSRSCPPVNAQVAEAEIDEATGDTVVPEKGPFQIRQGASMVDYLNPKLLQNKTKLDSIRKSLRQGNLVVVRDAFDPELAEHVWQDLTRQDRQWHHYWAKGSAALGHNSSKHKTGLVQEAYSLFQHKHTLKFMTDLSGRDCSGGVETLCTWSQPGGFNNPHADHLFGRTVSFFWQLSKNWDPMWGGAFYWGPAFYKNSYEHPSFNTLMIFSVRPRSMHAVTTVVPDAQSKRIMLGGFFREKYLQHPFSVEDPLEEWFGTEEQRHGLTKDRADYLVKLDLSSVEDVERRNKLEELQRMVHLETDPTIAEEESVLIVR